MSIRHYAAIWPIIFVLLQYSGPTHAQSGPIRHAPSKNVFLIGDTDHTDRAIPDAITKKMPAFKAVNPDVNCLFLEIDQKKQKVLDDFQRSVSPNLEGLFPEKSQSSLGWTPEVVRTLLLTAMQLKIRVLTWDIDFFSDLGQRILTQSKNLLRSPNDQENIQSFVRDAGEARSRYAANRLDYIYSLGICNQSILVIGSAHLDNQIMGVNTKPVQSYLSLKGFIPVVLSDFLKN